MSEYQVAVVMGSQSDWETMENSCELLKDLGITYKAEVVSAHRTPDKLNEFSSTAKSKNYQVIIAGAGGAAHLPGMIASHTELPVIGVPIQSKALNGMDSLLSIAQMPGGIPVATMSIGKSGAKNAALMAASILALSNSDIAENLSKFRKNQTLEVLKKDQLGSFEG